MTLRDLTKRQLYNLRRRCEKERRADMKQHGIINNAHEVRLWQIAFNKGLKAGLEQVKGYEPFVTVEGHVE